MTFIYPLCSSSKGNCVYVGTAEEGILIDAGVGIRNFAKHLDSIGVSPTAVKGIFVTHEHSDHISGLSRIQAKLQVPIIATAGTLEALEKKQILTAQAPIQIIEERQSISFGDLSVSAFLTSHDAAESCGYQIETKQGRQITVCTDLGFVSDEIHNHLKESDFVFLESNYEPSLLRMGSYPYFLKQRIAGERGHLSNHDCATEIMRLAECGVRQFVLGHLSEENNQPDLARVGVTAGMAEKGAVDGVDFSLNIAPKVNSGTIFKLM